MRDPSRSSTVCLMSGAFPPPVHGLSLANAGMRDAILKAGGRVEIFNTVAVEARPGGVPLPLRKIGARLSALGRLGARLIALRSRARLYLPVSGGLGQLAEIPPVLLARVCGAEIAAHHHSFAYVDRHSRAAALLFAACGRSARHIVLCERMGARLKERYPRSVGEVIALSNAAFHGRGETDILARAALKRIGYLSNITNDKGFDRFLDIVRGIRAKGSNVEAVVAGPCADGVVRAAIESAVSRGDIRYLGPVYGDAKEAFLRETDLLIFPSRYVNEAEPLVVIEALSHGAPVIATQRGCMPGMVDDVCGLVLDPSADDIAPAVERILDWAAHPQTFAAASTAALRRAERLAQTSAAGLERTLGFLGSEKPASQRKAP